MTRTCEKDQGQPARKVYEKPTIKSEEVFERTALACNGDAFLNSATNTKKSASSCGYSDS